MVKKLSDPEKIQQEEKERLIEYLQTLIETLRKSTIIDRQLSLERRVEEDELFPDRFGCRGFKPGKEETINLSITYLRKE